MGPPPSLQYLGSRPTSGSRLQLPADTDPGRWWWWLNVGSCHPHWRPALSLASAPGYCRKLQRKRMNGSALSISMVSVFLPFGYTDFQKLDYDNELYCLFLKKIFICLFFLEEREKVVRHLLFYSPDAHNTQDWARPKPEAMNSICVSHESGRDPGT